MIAILGWSGTGLYLAAYAYLVLRRRGSRALYYLANAVAAALLAGTSAVLSSWQAVGINGFWAVVSVVRLFHRETRFRAPSGLLFAGVATVAAAGLLGIATGRAVGVTVLGWSSALAFCGSYLLFAAGALPTERFHLYNLHGALALVPQLVRDGNWPVLALEACWAVLSLYGWLRARGRREAPAPGGWAD